MTIQLRWIKLNKWVVANSSLLWDFRNEIPYLRHGIWTASLSEDIAESRLPPNLSFTDQCPRGLVTSTLGMRSRFVSPQFCIFPKFSSPEVTPGILLRLEDSFMFDPESGRITLKLNLWPKRSRFSLIRNINSWRRFWDKFSPWRLSQTRFVKLNKVPRYSILNFCLLNFCFSKFSGAERLIQVVNEEI